MICYSLFEWTFPKPEVPHIIYKRSGLIRKKVDMGGQIMA